MSDWLRLPTEVRTRLRELFAIPRSGGSVVHSNVLVSDGTTYEDLSALTAAALQAFLDSKKTNFHELFDLALETIFNEQQVSREKLLEEEAMKKAERAGEISDRINDITKELELLSKEAELSTMTVKPRGRPKAKKDLEPEQVAQTDE